MRDTLPKAAKLVLLGALAPVAPAQIAAVAPGAFTAAEAPSVEFWALTPFDSRRQVLIGQSHLTPLIGVNLRGVSVRRNMGATDPQVGGRLQLEIWMSHTVVDPIDMAASFAQNQGSDHRQVFQGTIVLPAAPAAPSAPAPWAPPFAVSVALQAPFAYRGGTLCLETVTRVDQSAIPWWPVDAVVESGGGGVAELGQSCIPGLPPRAASADPGMLVPGATTALWLRGMRAGGFAVCMVGTTDMHWGGLALPLDLGSFGAPGCQLLTDMVTALPIDLAQLPNGPLGLAACEVPVPRRGVPSGASIYAQWLMPDPGVNALGVTFSNGVRAMVGSPRPSWDMGWLESPDLTSASGALAPGRAPVLRIDG